MRILITLVVGIFLCGTSAQGQADGPREIFCEQIHVVKENLSLTTDGKLKTIKDTIKLCTDHEYRFYGRKGQIVSLHLNSDSTTTFSLSPPKGDWLFNSGWFESKVFDWEGSLPSDGTVVVQIRTERPGDPREYAIDVRVRSKERARQK
jgi:hypothetical protein